MGSAQDPEPVPQFIPGERFQDERGSIDFFNAFDPGISRRLYCIGHPDTAVVRAWQGHRKENKWFFVSLGRFAVAWVRIDDWINPSAGLVAEHLVLDAATPGILFIPGGYANGLKAIEPFSQVMVFSDLDVAASRADSVRFPADRWMDWDSLS